MISVASIVVTVTNKSKRFKSCLPLSFFLCNPPWAAVTHKCAGTTRGCTWAFWPFPMVLLATPTYGTFGYPAYGPLEHSLSRIISYLCVSLLSLSERGTVRLLVSGQRFGGSRVPGVLSMG